jgi:hypothetical protein
MSVGNRSVFSALTTTRVYYLSTSQGLFKLQYIQMFTMLLVIARKCVL